MGKKSKYKTITKICPICQKEFSFKENKSQTYCSVECKVKSQEGRRTYKIEFDLEEIKRLYIEEKLSAAEISKRMGTYKKMILSRLRDEGIERRTSGESKKIFLERHPEQNPNYLPGVKEKQIESLKRYHKNLSEKRKEKWKEKISKSLKNLDPEKRAEQLRKSFETKNKNGTLYSSKLEQEIKEWIESLGIKTISNSYDIIPGKEIDIYLPDYQLAIEFDGLYWHSELSRQTNKKYHLDKTLRCRKRDIHLIHIFEDEWIEHKEIVQSIIMNKFNMHNNNIHTRKCEICELDTKQIKQFYIDNHIQGYTNSSVHLALKYNDEIVSTLSFAKPRFNKNYDWEITRFANKLNTNVPGSFARLLKYFRNKYSGSIITYSDLRYFSGKVYEYNGFQFLKYSQPNYWYTDYKFRYNRTKFQKHKLEEQLEVFDSSLSEWENMQLNGWDRIWDCGNSVYVLE
ncbi:MAG: hypothetical protein ACTSU6_05615 [Candidatus Njordarchaeales archaeon]